MALELLKLIKSALAVFSILATTLFGDVSSSDFQMKS